MAGAAILALLVWRLGTGPFLDGLAGIDVGPLALAAGITAITTAAAAWRWTLVARGLGLTIRPRDAIVAYYRSQFLNSVLPGGVLGDLHRGLRHGRRTGDVGRGLRAVGWERGAGQVVQIAVVLVVLLVLPSPVPHWLPLTGVAAVSAVLISIARLVRRPDKEDTRHPSLRRAADEIRDGILARPAWPGILLASLAVVAGHAAVFLVACRTTGVTAPVGRLLPIGLLVLLAMGLPTNVGGWGPREGMAAWMFALAGFGASTGVGVAVAYGVLSLAATLPGAVLLFADRRGRPAAEPVRTQAVSAKGDTDGG
ncbi:Uncharacterized membrane protein YbhN, UPF0104 family [Nakamurella panacisegetis]|uniref:Uncharacterized membrane protein YbhN, UPF0104 family n=1 Tax=Nakamurella panacisegetis TaxID=1090615 RepID=A0A1H0SVW7_9ACTN|nr:lysylphosphatidylglycerol synthase transmembrane domain-containing protein [Nakamurella panacisegetis]SDP45785.1 Uncharacterized membrane protein YbhN, UPF0104 family [Nakamurella panacisegetis]